MIYIAIGICGFLIIHVFDIVSLKKIPWAKPTTWILGSCLLLYSLVRICFESDKLLLPVWSTGVGWGLLAIFLFLLLYSLFINLPLRKTYIATGVGDKLIKTGLYSLVRHPGVVWFVLLMLSLVLVSKSKLLLLAAPIFILLDIVLVVVQDKFFFTRMFEGYDDYRQETPMFLPNRRSVDSFIKDLRLARTK